MNEADAFSQSGGQDGLTAFIEHARSNQNAFPKLSPGAMRLLVQLEGTFQRFRPALNASSNLSLTVLAVRCHSFYLSAASAAMAGSTAEVHPLLRAALECAGYAIHLSQNPALEAVWTARADRTDDAARKAVRKAFGHSEVSKSIDRTSIELGQSYRELYDATIDLGAHPNVIGVVSSFAIGEQASGKTVEHHILTGDAKKVLHTATMVGRAGLLSIQMLRSVFPSVYLEEEELASLAVLLSRLAEIVRQM